MTASSRKPSPLRGSMMASTSMCEGECGREVLKHDAWSFGFWCRECWTKMMHAHVKEDKDAS